MTRVPIFIVFILLTLMTACDKEEEVKSLDDHTHETDNRIDSLINLYEDLLNASNNHSHETENSNDSLMALFENKFELLSRPLQESLDQGISIKELHDVGFRMSDFIGLKYQGGLIFHIDSTGEHGLVAALEDLSSSTSEEMGPYGYEWGECESLIENETNIWTGENNTTSLLNLCPNLSHLVQTNLYEFEGFNDWYLPSIDELREMYMAIRYGSQNTYQSTFETNDGSEANYYSSSIDSDGYPILLNFEDGNLNDIDGKSPGARVRPIRSF